MNKLLSWGIGLFCVVVCVWIVVLITININDRIDAENETTIDGVGTISTAHHDGHKWILFSRSIVHHPDCRAEHGRNSE